MAEKTTWIKLDRNIMNWRWYQDPNTFRVFIHLLLNANIEERGFMTDTIHRGECVISIGKMAKTLGITYDQARTALNHLRETKEITSKQRPKYLVISITNYEKYQGNPKQNPSEYQANPTQTPTPKEYKNDKEPLSLTPSPKPYHIPTLEEVEEYERASGIGKNPESFYKHYESEGWKANGKKIYNWVGLYNNWEEPEAMTDKRPKRFTDTDGITYVLVNGRYDVERVRQ